MFKSFLLDFVYQLSSTASLSLSELSSTSKFVEILRAQSARAGLEPGTTDCEYDALTTQPRCLQIPTLVDTVRFAVDCHSTEKRGSLYCENIS